ncbi:MAG: LytTR family transcriptional regulator [Balneolaceae bacterium]|nr:LytTR family transcriptional regulator [Balneolaceae bacterium]
MNSHKKIYLFSNFLPGFSIEDPKRKYIYLLCYFGLFMAFLEFGQDYISSALNQNYFSVVQSLSYKLFWLLFAPFSIGLMYWFNNAASYNSTMVYGALSALLIVFITLAHLVVFSFLLFGISSLVYEDSWSIYYLLTEKLSTRLYIALPVYGIFSVLYYRSIQRNDRNQVKEQNQLKNITVKNGRTTTLVDVDAINWISSDGHYLSVHTETKEHVILDSLKSMITRLPNNFKRIHRSTIVNTDRIRKLKSRGNGDYDVIMDCGTTLRLSRNYTEPLRGQLL